MAACPQQEIHGETANSPPFQGPERFIFPLGSPLYSSPERGACAAVLPGSVTYAWFVLRVEESSTGWDASGVTDLGFRVWEEVSLSAKGSNDEKDTGSNRAPRIGSDHCGCAGATARRRSAGWTSAARRRTWPRRSARTSASVTGYGGARYRSRSRHLGGRNRQGERVAQKVRQERRRQVDRRRNPSASSAAPGSGWSR